MGKSALELKKKKAGADRRRWTPNPDILFSPPQPPHNAAEEPETLEVLRVPMSESAWAALVSLGVRSGVNELQRAVLESAGVRSGVDDLLSRPNGLVHA